MTSQSIRQVVTISIAITMVICLLGSFAPTSSAVDLTGIWTADDPGVYYLRQIESTVWWVGLSTESPQGVNDFQPGLNFTNVFRGTLSNNGTTLAGEWADVPRGQVLESGTLTLAIVSGV